jgi:hypothetical protein
LGVLENVFIPAAMQFAEQHEISWLSGEEIQVNNGVNP